MKNNYEIGGIFQTPVYIAKYESDGSHPKAYDEIKKIIGHGVDGGEMDKNLSNSTSINKYIFNTKLKKIKEFCEEHIKIYVKEIIKPKHKIDFYITQSWLNVTRPGESHHKHWHPNSLISGVYYILTVEDDTIGFYDPFYNMKHTLTIPPTEATYLNMDSVQMPVNANDLLLFPSWLDHAVVPNEKATTDRVSLSFNVFAKGRFGEKEHLNELII